MTGHDRDDAVGDRKGARGTEMIVDRGEFSEHAPGLHPVPKTPG
jgi:hypothetical protein